MEKKKKTWPTLNKKWLIVCKYYLVEEKSNPTGFCRFYRFSHECQKTFRRAEKFEITLLLYCSSVLSICIHLCETAKRNACCF